MSTRDHSYNEAPHQIVFTFTAYFPMSFSKLNDLLHRTLVLDDIDRDA